LPEADLPLGTERVYSCGHIFGLAACRGQAYRDRKRSASKNSNAGNDEEMARKALMNDGSKVAKRDLGCDVEIRRASAADVPSIVRLDEMATGQSKSQYWKDLYALFSKESSGDRAFLVAELGGRVVGFITGEIRSFEFGAERCGWIFAVTVDPEVRVHNVGTRLFEEICRIFAQAGVEKVRTIIERDNHLVMAFFRSQGMMVGRYIQMEKDVE
jgi:ribosomal protein S18 acetylase RimI-like enzyme